MKEALVTLLSVLLLPVNIRLLLVFAIFLAGFLLVHFRFTRFVPLREQEQMEQAASQAEDWFGIIAKEKEARAIFSDAITRIPHRAMVGDDFTFLTTTLGSLDAKEISTNPDFGALIVRLLLEAGAGPGDTVGLIISGSFPALAVSTLAALQVMEIAAVVISSLGASSFGANQPLATWIDMENWLIISGGLRYRSAMVSPGAENDRGENLTDEGMEMILNAAERNRTELYIPDGLLSSIRCKTRILEESHIRVLINIGGNQAALGGCAHASTLPNGLHRQLKLCSHPDRGIIQNINATGVPVIHLLHIADLAARYGIDTAPGLQYAGSTGLYTEREIRRGPLAMALFTGLMAMGLLLGNVKNEI